MAMFLLVIMITPSLSKLNIENYHCIKSLQFPPAWRETEASDVFPPREDRVFTPADSPEVRIEIFSRGLPVDKKTSTAFREILKTSPCIIFEQKKEQQPTAADVKIFTQIKDVLGNAGNNQIINTEKGFRGPSFIVEKAEVLNWSGKNLFALRGWFRDTDEDRRVNDFCGFFIDTNPNDPECQVEEIFLEAKDEKEFLRYLPTFKECLSTIQWMTR